MHNKEIDDLIIATDKIKRYCSVQDRCRKDVIKKMNDLGLNKKTSSSNKVSDTTSDTTINKNLWFVNVGGYDPNQLNELHEFGLVVAESSVEAKRKARQKFLIGSKYKHIDDIARLNKFELVDDCHSIINIHGWKVELALDPKKRSQKLIPDWYGFRRIVN